MQDYLTKLARGRECMIRIPHCCNGNSETVVGCHYRMAGLSGIGIKPHSLFLAYGCSACHSVVDTLRHPEWSAEQLKLFHCEAVLRHRRSCSRKGILMPDCPNCSRITAENLKLQRIKLSADRLIAVLHVRYTDDKTDLSRLLKREIDDYEKECGL